MYKFPQVLSKSSIYHVWSLQNAMLQQVEYVIRKLKHRAHWLLFLPLSRIPGSKQRKEERFLLAYSLRDPFHGGGEWVGARGSGWSRKWTGSRQGCQTLGLSPVFTSFQHSSAPKGSRNFQNDATGYKYPMHEWVYGGHFTFKPQPRGIETIIESVG